MCKNCPHMNDFMNQHEYVSSKKRSVIVMNYNLHIYKHCTLIKDCVYFFNLKNNCKYFNIFNF